MSEWLVRCRKVWRDEGMYGGKCSTVDEVILAVAVSEDSILIFGSEQSTVVPSVNHLPVESRAKD